MAKNKFFTILIVPEKTQQVRRLVIPHYIFNGAILALVFVGVLAAIMVLDYANVMGQISENRQLRVENRELKQSIQVFKNKLVTMDNAVDRVKTFVTKLKIITNIESKSSPAIMPQAPILPNIPSQPNSTMPKTSGTNKIEADTDMEITQALNNSSVLDPENPQLANAVPAQAVAEPQKVHSDSNRKLLLASLMSYQPTMTDASNGLFVQAEFQKLDEVYEEISHFTAEQEQEAQTLLEHLGDKRTLLASTPTIVPTLGYITSDYGVRISPYDGRRKMHEGIDIANRYGADIMAPADGTVMFAGVKPGYGKMVVLDHSNGIETRFAHASKTFVTAGEYVRRGQRIASVGSSGHSTGPHCHYEVHAGGLPVDPCWYILDQPQLCRQQQ